MNKNIYLLGGAGIAVVLGLMAVLMMRGTPQSGTAHTETFSEQYLKPAQEHAAIERQEVERKKLPERMQAMETEIERLTAELQTKRQALQARSSPEEADRGRAIIERTDAMIRETNQRLGLDQAEIDRRLTARRAPAKEDPQLVELNRKIETLRGQLEELRSGTL